MKTVSMELTAADKAAEKGSMLCGPCDVDMPDYPWGLRLHLDEVVLKKLGMAGLPEPGAKLSIVGTVNVVSCGSEERGGEKRRNLELVITDMGLSPEAAPGPTAAEALYGTKET